jgi:hypothetical protein
MSIAILILAGCVTHKDISHDPEVQGSGVLGQCYRTAEDLTLWSDKSSDIYRLGPDRFPDKKPVPRYDRVGILTSGTHLRVARVVRITEVGEFLTRFSWKCTLARIEDGKYAGKEVGVAGIVGTGAVIGSKYLLPCED